MPRVLDDLPPSQTVTEATNRSTNGRVRRPSEKVQVMLGKHTVSFRFFLITVGITEDHVQEKMATQKKADATAKRRKELTQKRAQAIKAAEQITRRSETQVTRGADTEDVFTSASNFINASSPPVWVDTAVIFSERLVWTAAHKSHLVYF